VGVPSGKVKVKLSRYRHAGANANRKYDSYSFLITALDEVSGQLHAPAVFYRRESTPVPTGQEAGWASELVWTQRVKEESFASAEDPYRYCHKLNNSCTVCMDNIAQNCWSLTRNIYTNFTMTCNAT
jgi:hypothetical protein